MLQQNPHHRQDQILKAMPEAIHQKRKSHLLGQAERLPRTTQTITGARDRSPKRQKLEEVLIVQGLGRRRKLIVNLKKVCLNFGMRVFFLCHSGLEDIQIMLIGTQTHRQGVPLLSCAH